MVRDGVVALERAGVGDVRALGDDREQVAARLRDSYPREKDGTIRAWTTVLLRFAFGPTPGDLVVHPDPLTRTFSIGRITGDYEFHPGDKELHVRSATWLATGVRREELSAGGQKDISQRPAFFELQRAGAEVERLMSRTLR